MAEYSAVHFAVFLVEGISVHYQYCCGVLFVQVYHPNIDLEGNICLNILREDWKPVLSISSVVYGLQFLFLVRHTAAGNSKQLELELLGSRAAASSVPKHSYALHTRTC